MMKKAPTQPDPLAAPVPGSLGVIVEQIRKKFLYWNKHSFTDEQLEELVRLLRDGVSPVKLGELTQQEWKIDPDGSKSAVQRNLYNLREFINKITVKAAVIAAAVGSDLETLTTSINALKELEALIQVQKKRLGAVVGKEEKMLASGILLNQVSKEIDLTASMLDTLAKHQLETGVLVRVPRTRVNPADLPPHEEPLQTGEHKVTVTVSVEKLNKLGNIEREFAEALGES